MEMKQRTPASMTSFSGWSCPPRSSSRKVFLRGTSTSSSSSSTQLSAAEMVQRFAQSSYEQCSA
ncbi:unnamed protein product [Symbiodinium pilosum]|uniref:Uncharacterized protein n=1 Tax=Symbiodinium pilosum TaxID=2952 RepID=A0A812LZN1_SYMPI|nr:unnamed protein product [Symbiodinium pilosum]